MSNQVLRVPFNGLVRIIANRDNSIRFNPEVAGKPVLNLTGVVIFGNKDEEDPVFLDISLWGDVAVRFKDSIEHSQIARIESQIEISLDEYNGETKLKGRIACNNGYQFMLFPSNIKGGAAEQTQVEVPAQSVAPAAKSTKKQEVPF